MSEDAVERRLATILVADVVEYSRLMSQDETSTLRSLGEHLFALINPTIGQFHGRIIKNMGDGFLVEFHSVGEAVECGIAIQEGMARRNQGLSEAEAIRFRIGVNLGDVLSHGDDVFGDGVNIAARLQEIAMPYGVMISSHVFGQLDVALQLRFSDTGAHQLKNIPRAIRTFQYLAAEASPNQAASFRPFVDVAPPSQARAKGGCLCGSVRYEIDAETIGSMLCHCRTCRRYSGAPVLEGTTFPARAFRFTKGAPKYYQSSKIARRGFCPDCGSPLVYEGLVSMWRDWIVVTTGSLDEPEKFPPTYHLGIESSLPWLKVHDDLPRTACKDSPSLIAAYREVGEEVP